MSNQSTPQFTNYLGVFVPLRGPDDVFIRSGPSPSDEETLSNHSTVGLNIQVNRYNENDDELNALVRAAVSTYEEITCSYDEMMAEYENCTTAVGNNSIQVPGSRSSRASCSAKSGTGSSSRSKISSAVSSRRSNLSSGASSVGVASAQSGQSEKKRRVTSSSSSGSAATVTNSAGRPRVMNTLLNHGADKIKALKAQGLKFTRA